MRKYRIIAQDEIDVLAAKVALLVNKEILRMGQIIAIADGQSSPFDIGVGASKRKRSGGKKFGGKSMSDWIYENVMSPEFTPSEAADILHGVIPDWNNPRAADSIRTALKNDLNRFERLPNGKYRKK
jgi:hypothetical protein